ncbi:MAG TPA: hypothetical protein VGR29_10355 [Thermomicrobiales bacterium]|nr:hypothetical protein [Thermomicrobiales bacterium]
MSDKIINFDAARRKNRGEELDMHQFLSQIDELEEALETMHRFGINTREELAELIRTLEEQAASRDDE